jgi:hypothetical protein
VTWLASALQSATTAPPNSAASADDCSVRPPAATPPQSTLGPVFVKIAVAQPLDKTRSKHYGSIHFAERVGDEFDACAVWVAEVQGDVVVFDELDTGIDEFGA